MGLPWVQDDISETERDAIYWLRALAYENETAATAIIAMPWAQDDISETERDAIRWLRALGYENETAATAIIAMPWAQDDISETERDAIYWLHALAYENETAATAIIAMPWVQDDISETERDAIYWLHALAYENEKAATAIIAMPWVQDDISETERDAIRWLRALGYENETAVTAIIAMPFLESLESDDVLTIRGMYSLADDGLLSVLIDHPTLQGGITGAQTTLVAATAALQSAEEISRMLSPGYAAIETVSSETELTPHLKISIIRTGSQTKPWTAEAVRDAVEFAERTMQLPLPASHVIVVLNDKAVTGNYAGTNHWYAIGYLPEYEQREDTYEFQAGLVHEVAHYYWRGNEDWIDEGLADTIEYMHGIENGKSPGLLKNRRKDCEAHNLDMLSDWNPDQTSPQFLCNYYLGQMLFQELRGNLGDEEFSNKLRELYLLSSMERKEDRTPGIAAVRQTFEGLDDIIDKHWSGAVNAPENRLFDEGVDRTSHDLIQWDQYPTYDGHSVTFSGTLLNDAVLYSETLHQAREGGYSNFSLSHADKHEYAGSILPPLEDGTNWILDDPGDSVAAEYRLYERAFTIKFPFPQALVNPSGYIVLVLGFRDGSRTPTIGENIDTLGYTRIRAD